MVHIHHISRQLLFVVCVKIFQILIFNNVIFSHGTEIFRRYSSHRSNKICTQIHYDEPHKISVADCLNSDLQIVNGFFFFFFFFWNAWKWSIGQWSEQERYVERHGRHFASRCWMHLSRKWSSRFPLPSMSLMGYCVTEWYLCWNYGLTCAVKATATMKTCRSLKCHQLSCLCCHCIVFE